MLRVLWKNHHGLSGFITNDWAKEAGRMRTSSYIRAKNTEKFARRFQVLGQALGL
jgi:hypothetical protein